MLSPLTCPPSMCPPPSHAPLPCALPPHMPPFHVPSPLTCPPSMCPPPSHAPLPCALPPHMPPFHVISSYSSLFISEKQPWQIWVSPYTLSKEKLWAFTNQKRYQLGTGYLVLEELGTRHFLWGLGTGYHLMETHFRPLIWSTSMKIL